MLHAGLDLSRRKVDVCLLSEEREHLDQLAVSPDVDSLRTLARRIDEVHGEPVCAVVESMTGARLVHDTLEQRAGRWGSPTPRRSRAWLPWLQDRQDRLDGAGGALAPRSGAGDLAARSSHSRGARARPLSPPPGEAQVGAQAPDPLDPETSAGPARSPTYSGLRVAGCLRSSTCRSPGGAT